MGLKHRLKGWLRDAYSAALAGTGLWRLVDRLSPPRLVILAGHCVADDAANGGLPADMKISAEKLERLLRALGRRFRLVTVGEGVAALDAGERRSMVALSMDDGYRDNRSVLLPLLERVDGRCTVFLESGPLQERRVDWSHKWFWLLGKMSAEEATRQLMARVGDTDTLERLRRVLEEGGDVAYRAKRVLKYHAPPADRDPAVDALFVAKGGDERALCERVFMDWGDVRALAASGRFELGGHTVDHHVLSTLDAAESARQIGEGRAALVEELGEDAGRTFAYPFGRRWDFEEKDVAAAASAGFTAAVTTHPAANDARSDRMRLGRWMIDEDTPLRYLVTEACGGFELLRRLGLDLVE